MSDLIIGVLNNREQDIKNILDEFGSKFFIQDGALCRLEKGFAKSATIEDITFWLYNKLKEL